MGRSNFNRIITILLIILNCVHSVYSQKLLAFPSAEGWGKYTVGGRGGHVTFVTNLKDSGPGSFREAVAGPKPLTVLFRVSGTIMLKSPVTVTGNTTIAGQTAPGDGICIGGHVLKFKGTQIIMRYFRSRLGDGTGYENDAVHGSGGGSDVILDHISASWSVDETFSYYASKNVTIQWCMVTESLKNSIHPKGDHGYGGLWGGAQNSNHHNLLAHHSSRNPRFKGDSDFRNNVIYNWEQNSSYGGGPNNGLEFNMVANYYKAGPATPSGKMQYRIVNPFGGKWYIKDNYVHGYPKVTADNWDGGVQDSRGTRVNTPFKFEPINQQTAEKAYELVLKHVGCSFPKRDALDARIINEVRTGTAKFGNNGLIDSQKDVGGWPTLNSTPAPADSDNDGMPDDWEKANGLNPNNAEDRNGKGKGGYTNLELYINGLVDDYDVETVETKTVPKASGLTLSNTSHSLPSMTFSLAKKSNVKLEIFALSGKKVMTLLDGVKEAGSHTVDYSGSNVNPGLYICKLSTTNATFVKNMILTRY